MGGHLFSLSLSTYLLAGGDVFHFAQQDHVFLLYLVIALLGVEITSAVLIFAKLLFHLDVVILDNAFLLFDLVLPIYLLQADLV